MTIGEDLISELRRRRVNPLRLDAAGYRALGRVDSSQEIERFLARRGIPCDSCHLGPSHVAELLVRRARQPPPRDSTRFSLDWTGCLTLLLAILLWPIWWLAWERNWNDWTWPPRDGENDSNSVP